MNHKIITNPRVIQCGTYYSKEGGYFRYRIKCGNIKECPRCRDRTLDFKRHQMLKTQEECLSSGGSLFIITGTLKHKKTDSLRYLQKKLRTAVGKLKNQKGWRKFQKQTTHPTRTVYETTYSDGVCQQSCPFFSRSVTQFLCFCAYLFRWVQPYLSDRTPVSDFA